MRMHEARASIEHAPRDLAIARFEGAQVPIGFENGKSTALAEDPRRFADGQRDVLHIRVDLNGDGEVEALIGEIQRHRVAQTRFDRGTQSERFDAPTCRRQHVGTAVDGEDPSIGGDVGGKLAAQMRKAGADVHTHFSRSTGEDAAKARSLRNHLGACVELVESSGHGRVEMSRRSH